MKDKINKKIEAEKILEKNMFFEIVFKINMADPCEPEHNTVTNLTFVIDIFKFPFYMKLAF